MVTKAFRSMLSRSVAAGACLLGAMSFAHAAETLNALVWCDHTDPALIEPFEQAHDVKVNLKEYEGTGAALSIVEQSRPGDWDVFVVDGVDVPRCGGRRSPGPAAGRRAPDRRSLPRAGDGGEPHP